LGFVDTVLTQDSFKVVSSIEDQVEMSFLVIQVVKVLH